MSKKQESFLKTTSKFVDILFSPYLCRVGIGKIPDTQSYANKKLIKHGKE